MAKVHFIKKARKSNSRYGIRRGYPYWFVWRRRGRAGHKVVFLSPPRPSQLANSPWEREFLGIKEAVANGEPHPTGAMLEALADLMDQAAESFLNLPKGFRNGERGELMKRRQADCRELIEQLQERR